MTSMTKATRASQDRIGFHFPCINAYRRQPIMFTIFTLPISGTLILITNNQTTQCPPASGWGFKMAFMNGSHYWHPENSVLVKQIP